MSTKFILALVVVFFLGAAFGGGALTFVKSLPSKVGA